MMRVPPNGSRRSAWPDRFDLATLAGGSALALSPLLSWVRRGPGNTLSGRDMIDAIVALGSNLPGVSAARLAVLWYLVPASGAALWVAVGFDAYRRTVADAAGVITLIVFAGFARLVGLGDLGGGAWLSLGGALIAAGASNRRRTP
jgi:hypothetical protein